MHAPAHSPPSSPVHTAVIRKFGASCRGACVSVATRAFECEIRAAYCGGTKAVAPMSSTLRHTRVLLGPHYPMRSAWPPDDHPTPYPPENLNGKVMLPDDPDHAALPDVPN